MMAVLDRLFDRSETEAVSQAEMASLIDGHTEELFRRVCILVGNAALVDDVAQETVVEALANASRYDRRRPLGPWLAGIALNVARRHWRRARRGPIAAVDCATLPDRDARPGDPRGLGPEGEVLVRERVALLYEALDSLSPLLRETFLLRAVEGLPAEEVARITDTTPGAVHTRVCRARDALRAWIDARDRSEGDRDR
jgi:RNA polymerase sigma-70 factor (ECF subfamily)